METKNLEKTTSNLAERYNPLPKNKDYEKKISLRAIKKAMIIAGTGTAISGAALAYSMFPDTIDSIIKYFF